MSATFLHSKDKPGIGRELWLARAQPCQPAECRVPAERIIWTTQLGSWAGFHRIQLFFCLFGGFCGFFPTEIKAESIYTSLFFFSQTFLVDFELLVGSKLWINANLLLCKVFIWDNFWKNSPLTLHILLEIPATECSVQSRAQNWPTAIPNTTF